MCIFMKEYSLLYFLLLLRFTGCKFHCIPDIEREFSCSAMHTELFLEELSISQESLQVI